MLTDKEIQLLFYQHPDGVNKEIFRKVCHISPRLAQYLLESGIVPCETRPQKTHKYLIATSDMIMFLRDRERHPEKYAIPSEKNESSKRKLHSNSHRLSTMQLQSITDSSYTEACRQIITKYPDIMSVRQVIEVIGYSSKKILTWTREKKLTCINIRGHVYIPKLALYEFMLKDDFRHIRIKSNRHWDLLKIACLKKD